MKTLDRARGRWREILPQLGVAAGFLVNRHGPCPICGGRDRYRFDDRNGEGDYYCNQCGAGVGIVLLRRLHGWDFKTACDAIDQVIGRDCRPICPEIPKNNSGKALERIKTVLNEAKNPKIPTDYLKTRGLTVFPDVLRGHRSLPYIADGRFQGCYPAMVAPIVGPDGSLQSAHRTYIADLPDRKKVMTPVDTINGAAVRLFPLIDVMGVSEGIETAVACFELFQIPTWAAICANGIETFVPPESINRLIVYADNDSNYAGQKAAFGLASRLSNRIEVDVKIPPRTGQDWLDVLNERRRG